MESKKLNIVHFNDCYELDMAAKFVKKFRSYDSYNPLRLFSGDVFSPSIASNFFFGEHMVQPLANLDLHVSCVGNHDYDFGVDHLSGLIGKLNFPWLLSNLKWKD